MDLNERVTRAIIRAEQSGEQDDWATVAMIELSLAEQHALQPEPDLVEMAIAMRGTISALKKANLHVMADKFSSAWSESMADVLTGEACLPDPEASEPPPSAPARF